jgi:membrane protein
MLGNIENAFNRIWDVPHPRKMGRKISDYLSAMIVCPVLFLVSSTATVVITSQVRMVVTKVGLLGAVSPAIFFLLRFLPYVVMWVLFTFVYMFMPNKKIHFKSGLFAGIVGGTIYQLFQWVYVAFQIGVAKHNAIYGSFAALPLFLVWLQVSWMIVLFGAEISHAHQEENTYEREPDCKTLSYGFRQRVMLQIVHLLVKRFSHGQRPLSANQISVALEIPIRLVWDLLKPLVRSGVLSELCEHRNGEPTYQPAQDVDIFTVKFVLHTLENDGEDNIPLKNTPELQKLSQCLASFEEAIQNSSGNVLLKDI